MDSIKTRGLVIRSTDYGEANRIITIFTEHLGIINANVYGAKSLKKGIGAASGLFVFGDILLVKRANRYKIEEIKVREGFFPLCEDITKLSLAAYFADLAHSAVGYQNRDDNILRLLLNSIYAICYNGIDLEMARTVFELRIAALGGYMPKTDRCACCDNDDFTDGLYFDIERGGILCSICKSPDSLQISDSARKAISYILTADDKRIFAFTASEKVLLEASKISERYVTEHFDRHFKTLEYYKKLPTYAQ